MSRKRSSTTLDDVPAASSSDEQSSSEEEQPRTEKKSTTQAKRRSPMPSTTPKKSEEPKTNTKEDKKSEKKPEKKNKSSDTEEPKKLFQRIWSEQDEITILTRLDEFAKKGLNIAIDMGALHEMIKRSVDFKECTQNQVNEKIKRMKEKYRKNARRDNYAPTKVHEKRTFELSHKLWAEEKKKPESEQPKPKPVLPREFDLGLAAMASGMERNTVVLQTVDQLPADVKADLIAKWKAVGLMKVDHCVRRTQLVAEELKSVYDSFNST